MPKSDAKTQVNVTLAIRPGPASPAQKTAWRRFWQHMIAEAKDEAKNG